MTKEELYNTKIWFGKDDKLKSLIVSKAISLGFRTYSDLKESTTICFFSDSFFEVYDYTENGFANDSFTPIESSQLLGTEQWEPKVGEWVFFEISGQRHGKVAKIIEVFCGGLHTTIEYHVPISWVRPARPEEIPQDEVEYVECTKASAGVYEVGKIYPVYKYDVSKEIIWLKEDPCKQIIAINLKKEYESNSTNFKPSTREAYEAQQGTEVRSFCKPLENVNKCSTINTNQNEYKNENREKAVLRRKTITVPSGQRKTGTKVHLKRLPITGKRRS